MPASLRGLTRALRLGFALTALAIPFVFGMTTATAWGATTDYFFPTATLPSGFGYAGVGFHSITYIQGHATFNGFCIAKDQGLVGYDFATRTVVGTRSCATSGGFVMRFENGNCCYHGWIDNDLTFTLTVFADTYATYHTP